MRIIASGHKAPDAENIPCKCGACDCHFKFRESEASMYVEDARDGDYWRVGCPECSVLNSVSVRMKGRELPVYGLNCGVDLRTGKGVCVCGQCSPSQEVNQ
jgi:hypothetical protein